MKYDLVVGIYKDSIAFYDPNEPDSDTGKIGQLVIVYKLFDNDDKNKFRRIFSKTIGQKVSLIAYSPSNSWFRPYCDSCDILSDFPTGFAECEFPPEWDLHNDNLMAASLAKYWANQ